MMDLVHKTIQVIVKKGKTHRIHRLTRSLKSLGRSVGRRKRSSIVNLVIKDIVMRNRIIHKIGDILRKELKATCSVTNNSIFKNKSVSALETFNWTNVAADLKRTAPNLTILLEKCTTKGVLVDDDVGSQRKRDITISVTAGILLRSYSERSNLIQRLFSVLMYANHSPKQVSVL